jgi:hypothetical protein
VTAAAAGVGWQGAVSSIWGLDVRAAFVRGETGQVMIQGGAADFTWTVGAVEGCAMFEPRRHVRVGPCLRIETGLLDVTGKDVVNGNTKHSLWVATGPVARLQSELVDALVFEFAMGPTLRVLTDRFYLLPDTATNGYTVGLVGLDAEVGLAVSFR